MKKVWITGENGFVAKNFERFLGHKYKVENSLNNEYYDYWRQNSQFNNKEIDIFDPTLETLIERADVDLIIHTADSKRLTKPDHMLRTNIEGSYHVSQVAKNLQIPLINIDGTDSYFYDYFFNLSKNTAASILHSECGSRFINIITSTIYGPYEVFNHIDKLVKSSIDQTTAEIKVCSIEDEINFLYIDDFLSGLDIVIDRWNEIKQHTQTVHIFSDSTHTLEDVIEYFDFNDIRIEYNIVEDNNGISSFNKQKIPDIMSYVNEYGWKEQYTLKQGLEESRRLWLK